MQSLVALSTITEAEIIVLSTALRDHSTIILSSRLLFVIYLRGSFYHLVYCSLFTYEVQSLPYD